MNINIICVGKTKESYFRDAASEYEKRLGRFCNINTIIIPDKSIPDNPSEAQCNAVITSEGSLVMKKIGKNDTVVALCVEGQLLTSEVLAEKMNNFMFQSSAIDFIIGGSLGLSDEVKQRADFKLSLSPMTFPHRIARIVLLEQLYRTFKINSNETYHK